MATVPTTSEVENSDTGFQVLLVEDNSLDVEIVRRSFRRDQRSQLDGAIELSVVNCLTDAEELLRSRHFDAILLDLGLPEGTGLIILEKLIALKQSIPIIILTGNEDDELGYQSLRIGADDFLKKSSISADTLPRSVRYSIERNQRIAFEKALHQAQAEIYAAETIQHKLLPSFSPEVEGFDIYGACLPAEKVGGDLFDFLAYDAQSCTGVVADVSGHGLPAAILMTELHGLLHGLVEQKMSLPRMMSAANFRTERATESYQFITMLAYYLSGPDRTFSYLSAGHPGWILKGNREEVSLPSQDLPLGIQVADQKPVLSHHRLAPGDIVVLPTDGIFETLGKNNERFGVSRMLERIYALKELPAKDIVNQVIADALQYSNTGQPSDDCTLVIIKA